MAEMIPIVPSGWRKPDPWQRKPHYHRRVQRLLERALEAGTFKPGTAVILEVFHDNVCAQMADKGPCNCCPTFGPLRDVGEGPFDKLAVVQLVHLVKTT
jgi:hypothetical protein